MSSGVRFDLRSASVPPSVPLAVDVRDGQGRLIVTAGQTLTSPLVDRLRKMGIQEVFIVRSEERAPGYWERWGEKWLSEATARLMLLDPPDKGPDEKVDDRVGSFKRILSEAVSEFVREENAESGT